MVNNPLGLPLDAWGNPSVTGYQSTFGRAPMQGIGQEAASQWGQWAGQGGQNPFEAPPQAPAPMPSPVQAGLLGNLLNVQASRPQVQNSQPQQPQSQPVQLGNYTQGPSLALGRGQQFQQPAAQARPFGQPNNGGPQPYTPREVPQPAGDPMKRLIDAIAASRANRK